MLFQNLYVSFSTNGIMSDFDVCEDSQSSRWSWVISHEATWMISETFWPYKKEAELLI